MARLQRQYRKQARSQARAETLPQIKGVQHSLHNQVAGLRTEEPFLQGGLSTAAKTIRHSPLAASDKAQLLENIATRQAGVPAGIASQVAGARESAQGEVGDLRQQQAASAASILSGLMTAHTEHAQNIADEIAAEGRQRSGAIDQAQLEQSLGLGSYATSPKTPQEEQLEAAELGKVNAETSKDEAATTRGGLTPYQAAEETERQQKAHDTAAVQAKALFEGAREAGKVPPDPKEWEPETWQHLVTATAKEAKVSIPVAQKAVGAIQNHFSDPQGAGSFDIVGTAAKQAAAAAQAQPSAAGGPAALLSMLGGAPTGVPELHGRRY